ncbi:hypothetical protein [Parasphingorhabdus sp.]|jgi:hypothetical protein|uniref:hypothetical protein n=1 Tax=Parasphingorhabdus sp. TaxID=2709688 RepID=UPI0007F3FEE5|nr:hypothetical protein A8B75_02980 [Sphingomonadales bacterium EhC05]
MLTFISFALISATSLATVQDVEPFRLSYSNCLTDFTTLHLDQKTGTRAFKDAAKSACADERNAMVSAITKDELEFGSSQSEATTYAEEEADGVLFSFTDGYAEYANSNTRPMKAE